VAGPSQRYAELFRLAENVQFLGYLLPPRPRTFGFFLFALSRAMAVGVSFFPFPPARSSGTDAPTEKED